MSFAHGAQDGLKFIGIMKIYEKIVAKNQIIESRLILIVICALTMGLGVLIGGRKIVTTVGENLVKLENKDALISDITTIITLIVASLIGIPLSTTHVKTVAVMAASSKINKINKDTAKRIIIAWILTFPVCGMLSLFITKRVIL